MLRSSRSATGAGDGGVGDGIIAAGTGIFIVTDAAVAGAGTACVIRTGIDIPTIDAAWWRPRAVASSGGVLMHG